MTATNLPAIGTEIEATRPADSFYKRVKGTVTGYRNGRIQIEATKVISKWDTKWSDHPSSCAMGISVSDLV